MIAEVHPATVRKYATRELMFRGCKHAIYGITFIDDDGAVCQQLAATTDKILYFMDDSTYRECVLSLRNSYSKLIEIHAVHKNMGP